MSLYLQHGYGKGRKITLLAASNAIDGVILSPADEDSNVLSRTVGEARELGLQVRVDPQTYIYSMSPKGVGRKHDSHEVRFDDLHWSQEVSAIGRQIARVGAMHDAVNPGAPKFAPTVLQTSLDDVWTSTAFQLARTSAAEWGRENTIATLAIEDTALDTWRQVDEWLDVATTLEVRGFYILVGRKDTSYPPVAWPTERLANLLRMIYVLSELNDYEVMWGYADSEGILGLAAGASAFAAGWNYSLRQFKPSKWQPSDRKGGAPPNNRFYVRKLWSPLLSTSETDNLYHSRMREQVFTQAELRFIDQKPLENLGLVDAQLQYLQNIASQARIVLGKGPTPNRLDYLGVALSNANEHLRSIEQEGIPLSARYRGRIQSLGSAIARFREAENL
ncbi:hypothetical protein [Microbacterium testaceum]|uniref:hypothetical protein n=1 Tax=Microbacterium testaceum TaxID=2033 RepID=UPI0024360389|nr:hypothetical protein [Microbacterium testaceum]